MIPWIITAGLTALLGAGAYYVFTHWDEILDWMRTKVLPEVSRLIREIGKHFGPQTQIATEVVATMVDGFTAYIEHHLYTKEPQGWTDTRTVTKIPLKELPARARGRIRTVGETTDITDVMEQELGTSI